MATTEMLIIQFYDSYNMRVVQNAETSYVNADNLTLTIYPGEGVLIVIEN